VKTEEELKADEEASDMLIAREKPGNTLSSLFADAAHVVKDYIAEVRRLRAASDLAPIVDEMRAAVKQAEAERDEARTASAHGRKQVAELAEQIRQERKGIKTLTTWAEAVHTLAKSKGWHDPPQTEDAFVERICNNLHDEVSELHEAWRNGKLHSDCDKADKMIAAGLGTMTYLEEELADIIIRTLDNAVELGVDIERAVERKHAFNATREQRHGGKRS
jgi:NTP pyrophosphatase (non-canonical NTP hydrolase)